MQPIQPLETYHTGINPVNASQLLSLLSERQLTPEQFDKIIPHTKEFLSDVKDLLSRQTEIDKLNHDQYIDNSFRVIDRLLTTMQENPTETERRYFLETINKIHDRISEVQKNEKNNNSIFKTILSVLGSVFMIVLVILTAGKFKRD